VIVVAGEALVDLIVGIDGRLEAVPGGGPFNVARTISRLNIPCRFLARISTDQFGRRLTSQLDADGVDLSLVVETDDPTTLAIAELDRHGGATYRFYVDGTSAAGLNTADLAPDLLSGVSALHVGTLGLVLEPSAATLTRVVEAAPSNVIVMTDPNCRPQVISNRQTYEDRLGRVLARTDIVKVSRDDLAYLAPGVPLETAASDLLRRGPCVVLLTDGPADVRIVTPGGTVSMPVAKTTVVDTVGAGDAFGGAFLAWLIGHGLGRAALDDTQILQDAATSAIVVARLTTSRRGANPPTSDEVALELARVN
jgi:Sugar kinases, ribokinase family